MCSCCCLCSCYHGAPPSFTASCCQTCTYCCSCCCCFLSFRNRYVAVDTTEDVTAYMAPAPQHSLPCSQWLPEDLVKWILLLLVPPIPAAVLTDTPYVHLMLLPPMLAVVLRNDTRLLSNQHNPLVNGYLSQPPPPSPCLRDKR